MSLHTIGGSVPTMIPTTVSAATCVACHSTMSTHKNFSLFPFSYLKLIASVYVEASNKKLFNFQVTVLPSMNLFVCFTMCLFCINWLRGCRDLNVDHIRLIQKKFVWWMNTSALLVFTSSNLVFTVTSFISLVVQGSWIKHMSS